MASGPVLRLALVRNVPQCRRGVPQPRTYCSQGGLALCVNVFTLHGFEFEFLSSLQGATRAFTVHTRVAIICKVRCQHVIDGLGHQRSSYAPEGYKSTQRKVVKPIKRSRVVGELRDPAANPESASRVPRYSCRVQ